MELALSRGQSNPSGVGGQSESVLFRGAVDEYSEASLARLVDQAIAALQRFRDGTKSVPLAETQISIRLTSDDPAVRPALHLTEQQLRNIALVGGSLDFDPVVSPGVV